MDKNQKIDNLIMKRAKMLSYTWYDDNEVVDYVFRKFAFTNFFRIIKIHHIDISNHLQNLRSNEAFVKAYKKDRKRR